MTEEEKESGEAINHKDVTYDFILNDEAVKEEEEAAGPAPEEKEKGDHPVITLLDLAINQSGIYLKKQGLPPANTAIYEGFSRPFLNAALWEYLPDGDLPDDPRIGLALGVGGLGLAFAPTLLALKDKKEKEEKAAKTPKKAPKKEEEEKAAGPAPVNQEEEEPAGPDWLDRLEGGGLPGM